MQNPTLNKVVEWNPGHSNQFCSGQAGKLELCEILSDRVCVQATKEIFTHPHAITPTVGTCLSWHLDEQQKAKSVMAYGTSTGQVSAISWTSKDEVYCLQLYAN